MSETLTIVHDSIRDDAIYTPSEIGHIVKVSASYVREEIKRGNLKAFRFGEKLIRIKGSEARLWIGKFADISSESFGAIGASSGKKGTRAGDTALLSVLKDRLPRA